MKANSLMKILIIIYGLLLSNSLFALKPEKKYVLTPQKYGLMYKEVCVETTDSLNIKMWFIPAQQLLPIEEIKKINKDKRYYDSSQLVPMPTIIFCNGDSGNMSYNLPLAMEYIQQGFNVVLFDWRGFGESDHYPLDENRLFYNEFLIDYSSVVNAVYEMNEVDNKRIALTGYSTGAYLSFATAYNNNKIQCLVVRGLMTNFEEVISQLISQNFATVDELKLPKEFPEKICPKNIASQFDKPIFLIVGENDDRTPVHMSQTIYNRIPEVKKIWIVDNAGHGGRRAPEVLQLKEYVKHTVQFYNKNLKITN